MRDHDKEEVGLAEIADIVEGSDMSETWNIPVGEQLVKQEFRKIRQTIY